MSLGERLPPDDPREWLNRAKSNLAIAKNRVTDAYLEDLCFEAQQAADKGYQGAHADVTHLQRTDCTHALIIKPALQEGVVVYESG